MNNNTNASTGTNTSNTTNGTVNNNNSTATTNDDEISIGDTTTCLLDLLSVSNSMLKLQIRDSPDPFDSLLSPTSAVGSNSVFDDLFVPPTTGAPSSVFDSLLVKGGCNASRLRPRLNNIDELDDITEPISGGGGKSEFYLFHVLYIFYVLDVYNLLILLVSTTISSSY